MSILSSDLDVFLLLLLLVRSLCYSSNYFFLNGWKCKASFFFFFFSLVVYFLSFPSSSFFFWLTSSEWEIDSAQYIEASRKKKQLRRRRTTMIFFSTMWQSTRSLHKIITRSSSSLMSNILAFSLDFCWTKRKKVAHIGKSPVYTGREKHAEEKKRSINCSISECSMKQKNRLKSYSFSSDYLSSEKEDYIEMLTK